MKKLFITSDHAAFDMKEELKLKLNTFFKDKKGHGELNYELIDLGTNSSERVDYPDFGKLIAKNVLQTNGLGIALCGSGIGISMQVNRFKGIRGALCKSKEDARLSKEHNNANIICLGARGQSSSELFSLIETWMTSTFEAGRHKERIEKLDVDFQFS